MPCLLFKKKITPEVFSHIDRESVRDVNIDQEEEREKVGSLINNLPGCRAAKIRQCNNRNDFT